MCSYSSLYRCVHLQCSSLWWVKVQVYLLRCVYFSVYRCKLAGMWLTHSYQVISTVNIGYYSHYDSRRWPCLVEHNKPSCRSFPNDCQFVTALCCQQSGKLLNCHVMPYGICPHESLSSSADGHPQIQRCTRLCIWKCAVIMLMFLVFFLCSLHGYKPEIVANILTVTSYLEAHLTFLHVFSNSSLWGNWRDH